MKMNVSKPDSAAIRSLLRLYLVMSLDGYAGRTAYEIAEEAVGGGVTVIQLREKDRPWRDALPEARRIRELCRLKGIPFIVNDRVDVALVLDADGVHVGQDDLPGKEARALIGPDRILGISAGTLEEARWAVEQGADYLGVGAIYNTATKADAGPGIGAGLLTELKEAYGLPMVGIGGIGPSNAAEVLRAGADGVAVVSAITRQPNPREAAEALRAVVDRVSQGTR
ncbi:thiamine phosphate synthase [Gorillibacterium sp. sgz5001074]|uniref:thiamine phosphate synthase n=1 Tax=Gorillibacterium sp. sgz5001074 TaxID=3446695 RepID=UPI003F673878